MEIELQCAISSRKAKLAQLTCKMNRIRQLMEDSGDNSPTAIQIKIEFNKQFEEFCDVNTSVKGTCQQ